MSVFEQINNFILDSFFLQKSKYVTFDSSCNKNKLPISPACLLFISVLCLEYIIAVKNILFYQPETPLEGEEEDTKPPPPKHISFLQKIFYIVVFTAYSYVTISVIATLCAFHCDYLYSFVYFIMYTITIQTILKTLLL